VVDIFHMGTERALAAGAIGEAVAVALRQQQDASSRGLPHFAANHLVVPFTMQGRFEEALAQTEIMQRGWERAGRPVAGWLAPSFLATALIHGLRSEWALHQQFLDLAMAVRMKALVPAFSYFVLPRVAMHHGDIHRALHDAATDATEIRGPYTPFARALAVEVAVVAGVPDADSRLAAARGVGEENDYAAAYLLRAAGRLHDDEVLLAQAVLEWETLGARFERACTLQLLPSRRAEGEAEIAAMGCAPPGDQRQVVP
jgi:hypothetical protein